MPTPRPPTALRLCLAALGLGLALSNGVMATPLQAPPAKAEGPVKPNLEPPAAEPSTDSFARKLGLGFTAPPGAQVTERRSSRGQDILYIVDGSDAPRWTITFQRLPTSRVGETAPARIDAFLAEMQAQEPPPKLQHRSSIGLRVLGGKPEEVFPAELVYMEVSLGEDQTGVSGLLVAQTSRDTFLYGTLFALLEGFDQGPQQALEDLFASLRIQPTSLQWINEADRMLQGASILSAFTPEVLRDVAEDDTEEFYRIYEDTTEGEVREVGWQRLTTKLAPISAVTSPNDAHNTPAVDAAEMGLLVTIEGEIVEFFPDDQVTVDILNTHWLSLDRRAERWSIIRTPRRILKVGNRRTETEVGTPTAETGIRTKPQPRSTITIIDSNGLYDSLDTPIAPEPFLSSTELSVLGRLLHTAGIETFEADWYVLDRTSARGPGIRKRSDVLTQLEDGSGWSLKSLGPSGPFEQRFATSGLRLERITPLRGDAERTLVLERIDPEDLIQLYKQKDLPVR